MPRHDDFEDDLPKRERDDDDRTRQPDVQLSWLDRQFTQSGMLTLILFSLLFFIIALPFGIVGVVACEDSGARQNAMAVLILSVVAIGIAAIVLAARAMLQNSNG